MEANLQQKSPYHIHQQVGRITICSLTSLYVIVIHPTVVCSLALTVLLANIRFDGDSFYWRLEFRATSMYHFVSRRSRI